MFARISFDTSQKVSKEELKKISDFLADEVTYTEMVKVKEGGEITDFYSWRHTFDPNETDKELVEKTDMVALDSSKEYLADVNSFLQEFPKVSVKIRGMIQTSNQHINNLVNQMLQIENKLTDALQSFNEKIEFNQKCDVHVPGLGLMNINQLGYAIDICTERLQDLLNSGWRIVTVCPQPDQRRPDYILGRFNPNGDSVECFNF